MHNYKVYDKTWTYKYTISPDIIINNVSFTANSNWWQWQFKIQTKDELDISWWDYVKVYRKTNLIYSWVFQNKETIIWNSTIYEYPVLWLSSVLSMITYNWSASITDDPANIAKLIIDQANTIYNFFTYDSDSIPLYWSSLTITFDLKKNFLEALKLCYEIMGRKLYINQFWKVFIKSKGVDKDYSLAIGREIAELQIVENIEDIVNNIIVFYSGWSYSYQDSASITSFWQKDYIHTDTNLNLAGATAFAQNYIANNSQPKKEISATIVRTDNFEIDNINILDIVRINNTKNSFWLLQIEKYSYNEKEIKVNFENYSSFWKEILNLTK